MTAPTSTTCLARKIQQPGAGLEALQRLGIDQVMGLLDRRHVQA